MVAQSPPVDYVVGPQDVLTVQVFDQADLGGKYTVETDGTFSFPLIGRVTAGGLTLRKFESRAEEAAGRRLLHEPAGHRGGRAVPEPARVRDGRGAQPRPGAADRRHDPDRGARAGRVDAALGLRRGRRSCAPPQATSGPTLPNPRRRCRHPPRQHPRARERLAAARTSSCAMATRSSCRAPKASTCSARSSPRVPTSSRTTRRCCRRCRWPAA